MKKRLSVCLILALCICFQALAGCNGNDKSSGNIPENVPDYSSSVGEFITFGYSSPTDGSYTINGVKYSTGEDYRTAERYKEYADAGLNTMLIQGNDAYGGEDFATSQLKKNMDNCVEAGIERCIVFDSRLQKLSSEASPIVGDGCKYETQETLNAYVAECMKDYSAHEIFYGVMLVDEPNYNQLPALGSVYKAIKAFDADCYIEANLLPINAGQKKSYCADYNDLTLEQAYEKYLRAFVEYANADKICFDSYPIRESSSGYSIGAGHIRGVQIAAEICKEKGIALEAVAQTCKMTSSGAPALAAPTTATMNWQNNVYLGFGIETIGYFTYWRKQDNNTAGEFFVDGTSFMTTGGEKTSLYYEMQTLHKQMQSFAPVILNFKYSASSVYTFLPVAYSTGFIGDVQRQELKNIESVNGKSGGVALVTELEDSQKGYSMYMVMNALNPDFKRDGGAVSLSAEIKFKGDFTHVAVYYKGDVKYVALKDGVYTVNLDAGYAEYLIPFKA